MNDNEEKLIEFCKATITKDNVNRIPADWNHDLLEEHQFTLDHCKKAGYGFLPLMMIMLSMRRKYRLLGCWFVMTWKHMINLDAEYPYTLYYMNNNDYSHVHPYSSLIYCISWCMPFAHFLLLSGATPTIESFRHLLGTREACSSDTEKQVALFHFDHGVVSLKGGFIQPWIQEKCRDYAMRRAHCQRAFITAAGILRRRCQAREPGWDRHFVQHLMRYVWATRRQDDWNPA